ncbi:MAG: proton-conducting membrane transporter [Lachnospiraceae bacterium]|nr:proton-conducting membrane transporter [Lachnospiraceae bacterium]
MNLLLLIPILLPLAGGICSISLKPLAKEKARTAFVLTMLIASACSLLPVLLNPELSLKLFTLSDSLPVVLKNDPVGKFFAVLIAVVWTLAGAYSFEYMAHEGHLNRFYCFYLCTMGVLFALCFSATIITYYMFYEMMSLMSVPLVMHTMKKDAVAAGVKFLIYSVVGASLVLLGIFLISPYVSGFAFSSEGVLNYTVINGHETRVLIACLLMLVGFGTKAGMFPLHGWLPTAHPAAPSPASAVLSGIITKTGVLGVIRVVFFFIGAGFIRGTWVQYTFICLTLFTVLMGSLLAFREKVLKKRLAYSSVSQVSYVLFGIATLTPFGLIGAFLHIIAHSLIKDTLFMSAGAIIEKTGKTKVFELRGIGKQMPIVMWCFTLTSVGLIGIPPCLGFVSKWYLAQGALDMNSISTVFNYLGPAILLISALLTAGYLLPISIKGFFPGTSNSENESSGENEFPNCEPTYVMLVPMIILTALSILIGMFPGQIIGFISNFMIGR